MLTDEELDNLAKEELLKDARCAAVRAGQYGAHRWAKPSKLLVTNKRFLKHMILNNQKDHSSKHKKLDSKDNSETKETYEQEKMSNKDKHRQHEKRKSSRDNSTKPKKIKNS